VSVKGWKALCCSLWETYRRATERHLPYGITQHTVACHLVLRCMKTTLNKSHSQRSAHVYVPMHCFYDFSDMSWTASSVSERETMLLCFCCLIGYTAGTHICVVASSPSGLITRLVTVGISLCGLVGYLTFGCSQFGRQNTLFQGMLLKLIVVWLELIANVSNWRISWLRFLFALWLRCS